MGTGYFLSPTYRLPAPVKHKVFVSYHHKGDQAYYNAFSQQFHDAYNVIYDASVERIIDSDNVDYVMQKIRDDYITGSSCTIVLVGAQTWGRRYVDWEIKSTLDKEHALIGVQLPSLPVDPTNRMVTVPPRLADNIASGFAVWIHWDVITFGAARLEQCIAAAKSHSTSLISNSRERRLRSA